MVERISHSCRIRHIEMHRQRLPALLLDVSLQLPQTFPPARRQNDLGAMRRQHSGKARSKPRGRAGDESNFS
jgi:hypothetical protein